MSFRKNGARAEDPRAVIFEAYQIPDITAEMCRAVFLDWILSDGGDVPTEKIRRLYGHYKEIAPDHPMTDTLAEGLAEGDAPRKRRGGWRRNHRQL